MKLLVNTTAEIILGRRTKRISTREQGTQTRVRGRSSNHAKNTGTLPETEDLHNYCKGDRETKTGFVLVILNTPHVLKESRKTI